MEAAGSTRGTSSPAAVRHLTAVQAAQMPRGFAVLGPAYVRCRACAKLGCASVPGACNAQKGPLEEPAGCQACPRGLRPEYDVAIGLNKCM